MWLWVTVWLAGLLASTAGVPPASAYRPPGSSTRSAASSRTNPTSARALPHSCNFEELCSWKHSSATKVVTGQEVNNSWVPHPRVLPPGPFVDASNNTHGHFLYTYVKNASGAKEVVLRSPRFMRAAERCRVEVALHMANMNNGVIKLVIEASNQTSLLAAEKEGNNLHAWTEYSFPVGRKSLEFNIILEIVPANKYPYHIAIDNIVLVNCFPDPPQNVCSSTQFQCANDSCIDPSKVCNINKDCPNGEDEEQDCTKVPEFARCNFENGWCGWHNAPGNLLNWTKNNGSTATAYTGPNFDHTYQNNTGLYLYVDMTGKLHELGTAAALESPIINPPPKYHSNASSHYYNSCFITFHYHKYGPHSGSLGLFLIELQRNNNVSTKLWWSYGDKGEKWLMQVVTLPNITYNRYYLQFEARKSFASRGDPAIDDISMSPKCFGIGVPEPDLGGYKYENFTIISPLPPPTVHQDFVNSTVYTFKTCGKKGRIGPTQENCTAAYNNTNVQVSVLNERSERGIQKWVVPETGYYTIIAKGASGGQGSDGKGSSYGSIVRGVVELTKGQNIYILVGQEGNDACRKEFMSKKERIVCRQEERGELGEKKKPKTKLGIIVTLTALPEGGGGGGGTFIFLWHRKKEKEVLIVAGGGGGMSHGSSTTDTIHNGHGINSTLLPTTGDANGKKPAGAGGGWMAGNYTYRDVTGVSLLQGGIGGRACYTASDGSFKGAGGFGGGGGGCTAGGGGGGYTGGRSWGDKSEVGEGGYSWVGAKVSLPKVWLGVHKGPGEVLIIPALSSACGCDYRCLAMDMYPSRTKCICPSSWLLANDTTTCILTNPTVPDQPFTVTIILIATVVILILIIFFIFIFLYNNYQKKKAESMRHKMASGPDLQLNRLRGTSDSMVTEYNPNYEFGGGSCSLRDLKEIPREHLRLVKALGQGAFGEVYQGFFKNRVGDAVEMPVAVKTLPELSTNQNETDFFMEALIMSKFNHPNIVHFIGVCFDKHPRFIVIELLAGGDLKTFLRESRPKPERASPLTMKDLVTCIVDVAKGCKYLEEFRFIHRDIAARNCLLTTKGPGRVVKIADFGMARDIYRADYYRKGGKAMLPIKWMPPEAFLDGIFTSKTDVWSFGVIMWEVMSLGYMPYTGCANREVMQLVTSGGRLEPPTNCPPPIYAIMTQCWHPSPDERPPFTLILERLGYCTQDPDVMKAPLPVYTNPPSAERDMTVMRPREDPLQPDYLIPLPGGTTNNWSAETRQSQPLLTPPAQDKHPRIFTVSHNIKQDTAEIAC